MVGNRRDEYPDRGRPIRVVSWTAVIVCLLGALLGSSGEPLGLAVLPTLTGVLATIWFYVADCRRWSFDHID